MEKYLRHEPLVDKRPPSCKRSRLSNVVKVKGRIMAGCKSPSVDDILAFKVANFFKKFKKSKNIEKYRKKLISKNIKK
jgi:hypothetical protein